MSARVTYLNTSRKSLKERCKVLLYNSIKLTDEPDELRIWETSYLNHHLCRYVEILNLIPKIDEEAKVLDVGSGAGHISILLSKIFGYEVESTDVLLEESKYWQKRLRDYNVGFEPFDLNNLEKGHLPFESNSFDIALFCDAIGNLSVHPLKVFNEIRRILKIGGYLIFTTDNILKLTHRIRMLFGENPVDIRQYNPPKGHFREYSAPEISYLLDKCNFKCDAIYFKYIPYYRGVYHAVYSVATKLRPSLANWFAIRAIKEE